MISSWSIFSHVRGTRSRDVSIDIRVHLLVLVHFKCWFTSKTEKTCKHRPIILVTLRSYCSLWDSGAFSSAAARISMQAQDRELGRGQDAPSVSNDEHVADKKDTHKRSPPVPLRVVVRQAVSSPRWTSATSQRSPVAEKCRRSIVVLFVVCGCRSEDECVADAGAVDENFLCRRPIFFLTWVPAELHTDGRMEAEVQGRQAIVQALMALLWNHWNFLLFFSSTWSPKSVIFQKLGGLSACGGNRLGSRMCKKNNKQGPHADWKVCAKHSGGNRSTCN